MPEGTHEHCWLRHIGAAITPGGRIHIVGRVLDDSRLSPLGAVGFNLLALNSFDAGGAHTERAHREWLTAVGFAEIERVPLAEGLSLMTARKPV